MIKLGEKVKCIVTDFEGIAVSRIEYLNGCIQYGVKPKKKKNGDMPDTQYIDIEQLKVVGKKIAAKKKDTGGEQPDCPKS